MGTSAQRGLRIGIDGTCLGSRRGYGRYLRELLPPLLAQGRQHDFVIVLDRDTAANVGPLPTATLEPATRVSQAAAASARGNRSLHDMWTMGRAVARERFDLMFFPSVYSYFPVLGRTPVAVCMHDVIAERYGRVVFPSRRTRWQWRAKVAAARTQARALLTVSDWSRQALAEHFQMSADEIFVTGEAASAEFAPVESRARVEALLARHGIEAQARFLIYVGGFNPHKNLHRLIDAFERVRQQLPADDPHLLLVGDFEGDVFHADMKALRNDLSATGLLDRVHLLGFVPDPDLRLLYAGAELLVLPSLEEGFGLPAVEAAACGTPCVATRNSPLPQLLEGAGRFIDPTRQEELASALVELLSNAALRKQLGERALEAARELSWDRTAERTLAALESVVRSQT